MNKTRVTQTSRFMDVAFYCVIALIIFYSTVAFVGIIQDFAVRADAKVGSLKEEVQRIAYMASDPEINDNPPKAVPAIASAPKAHKYKAKSLGTYTITFYCPCKKCCGKTNGITASGAKAKARHTIAAPKGIAFGTKIKIEGLGTYIVEDRGGSIKGKRLDVFVKDHKQALKLGKRSAKAWIVK